MATTVRIDDDTKAWLERLRAELTLATGRRHSLEQVLHLVTRRAVQRPDVLLPEAAEDRGPTLTDQEWDAIFRLPRRYPGRPRVRPRDIDDVVTEDTR